MKNERGFALITTLLISVVIFILCMGFMAMSLTENFNARRYQGRAHAFHAADAGIEHARATLPLTAPVGGTLGLSVYSATIVDNLDGSYTITATGIYQGWTRSIEARYSPIQPPVVNAGIEIISPDGETEIELEDGAKIDGNNWEPPADPSACIDVDNCGTPVVGGTLPGVMATASELEVEVLAPSVIEGTPPTVNNSGNSATPWNELVDQLVEMADRVVTDPDSIGPLETRTWGTAADPEITVIENWTDLQGTINGAGFLIVESGGDLELDHGELNWIGMVIIRGTGEVEVEFETDDDATLRIFGSVMMLTEGSDIEIEMEIENAKSFVKYSASGVTQAFDSLPTHFVGYWHEL